MECQWLKTSDWSKVQYQTQCNRDKYVLEPCISLWILTWYVVSLQLSQNFFKNYLKLCTSHDV